jgi:hypothetical protein
MVFGALGSRARAAARPRRRTWALAALLAACCGLCLFGASGAFAETVAFTTPGCTTWTAPAGSHFQIQATGAPGSPGGSYVYPEEVLNSGGAGGRADVVSGALAGVSAGTRLFVCVNVGGASGGSSQGERRCEETLGHAGCFLGGAGGGASGVGRGEDFSQPVLVAGGGGGGGGLSPYGVGAPAYNGGAAGEAGGGGERELQEPYSLYDDYFGGGGGGASGSEGGAGGEEGIDGAAGLAGSQSSAVGPGAGGSGGYGEYNGPCSPCEGGGGGGGGGGYFGGGGGAGGGIDGGGGGGGSSLVPAGGTLALASPSAQPQVQISYIPGPSVATEATTGVAQSTATLNATVNPNGQTVSDCHFEYGPTETYGSVAPCEPSPGSGASAVAVTAALTGLEPKSRYHFRIVATNEGTTNRGADETFETLPDPPTVTGVGPAAGLEAGGTPVTITGAGFAEATEVKFGSAAASHFTIDSATSITAIAPAQTAGTVQVTVANAGGSSASGAADEFLYVQPGHAPSIKSLSLKQGPAAGGSTLTITGAGFVGVTAVKFGSADAASFTVNSATSITAESPPGAAGRVEVSVTTPNGESPTTAKNRFTFGAPTVTSVVPDVGSQAGATPVTITGSGFAPGSATAFKFGRAAGTSVDCTSTTTCTVRTPAASKTGAVEVLASVGKAKSKKSPPADRFTYD